MNGYLKQYDVYLKTVGPVFIGNGKEIEKKEYVFFGKDKVGILDIPRFYQVLIKRGKSQKFEEYLLNNGKEDLGTWLNKERISINDVKPFMKYMVDCEETVVDRKRELHIMEMMKDPYGNPYIPGSSLKGMLRTILLSYDLIKNASKYSNEDYDINHKLFGNLIGKQNRNNLLKNEIKNIEGKAFNTLQRNENKRNDAVNDCFQGVIVSDSEALSTDDLVLCQRIEVHPDGTEKKMNVLRECIKPGKTIHFQITIDSTICNLTEQNIKDAIKQFITIYQIYFGIKFKENGKYRVNQVLLGGGTGFVSKTIVYPMYRKQGIKVCKEIFYKTKVPKKHGHQSDDKLGVSPHILKCTKYHGELIEMGLCNFTIRGKN